MTSKDFRELQQSFTNPEIMNFAVRLCEKNEFDPVKEYPQTYSSEVMKGAARRQLYLSKAINLLRREIFLGATLPEVLRVAEYLLVVNKSVENSLDFRRCYDDLKISDLDKKYTHNELVASDISLEEFMGVLERDRDFYGVLIKEETT